MLWVIIWVLWGFEFKFQISDDFPSISYTHATYDIIDMVYFHHIGLTLVNQ